MTPSNPAFRRGRFLRSEARGVVLGLLLSCVSCAGPSDSPQVERAPDVAAGGEDSAGLELPAGFRAWIVADAVGPARHLGVRDNGDLYVALRRRQAGGGIVALRDTTGDRIADRIERFGDHPGTGIALRGDELYFGADDAVYRYRLTHDRLVPREAPEVWVHRFPSQRSHAAKSLALDDRGGLYVNVGAPSNACQQRSRSPGSPGIRPCPQLERAGGIWRFAAGRGGQTQVADGRRFATGVRNAVALEWNPLAGELYAVIHGRDQLDTLWPAHFSAQDNAELPAEEFHLLQEGTNCGWPYTYFDGRRGERMVAPEYGGDGKTPVADARYAEPLVAFPAHWAPNDLLFYTAEQFPPRYRGGAFVAFHGSWNRAPFEQQGYQVVFVPFREKVPAGPWEPFADGFAGPGPIRGPGDARFRPMGLAQGPSGELYIADSVQGRIWGVEWASPR